MFKCRRTFCYLPLSQECALAYSSLPSSYISELLQYHTDRNLESMWCHGTDRRQVCGSVHDTHLAEGVGQSGPIWYWSPDYRATTAVFGAIIAAMHSCNSFSIVSSLSFRDLSWSFFSRSRSFGFDTARQPVIQSARLARRQAVAISRQNHAKMSTPLDPSAAVVCRTIV